MKNIISASFISLSWVVLTQCSNPFGGKSGDDPDLVAVSENPGAGSTNAFGQSSSPEVNGIAVKVNGKVITKKEVAFHMSPTISLLRAKYPKPNAQFRREYNEAQDSVVERLIDNKIVLSQVERNQGAIPDHVLDEEVNRIIREVYNGSESEFRKALKETGMTMRSFRESQREKILVQAYRAQQFQNVAPPTAAEVKAYYNKKRNDLRDRSQDTLEFQKIFIRSTDPKRPGATPDEQLAFTESLAAQLRRGADFSELAREHSADAFADQGGKWPETNRLDLSAAFAEVLFDAPLNQITGPLKDPYGFTIVKVTKKTYGPAPSFSKVKDRMEREVEIEKRAERYNKWIKILKRNAMIDRRI